MKKLNTIQAQEKIRAIIEARNKHFESASNAQKRVMIAQDVIERLKKGQYIAQAGNWLCVDPDNVTSDESLQQAIIHKDLECTCCALGGLVASCVVYNNNAKVGDVSTIANGFALLDGDDTGTGLMGIFSQGQLALIEYVFERGEGGTRAFELPDYIRHRARAFYNRYPYTNDTDHACLIAIMENIVRNKGTFKP